MNATEARTRIAWAAWLAAASAAYLWQFVPLLPHILRAIGVSS